MLGVGFGLYRVKDVLWAQLHEKHMWATYISLTLSAWVPLYILPDFSATHIPQKKSEGRQGPYKEPKRSGITDTSQKFSPSVCSHSSGARWLPMWLSQPSSSASGVPGNSHLFSYPFLAWSLTVRLYKVPSSPTPTLVKP